MPDVFQVILVKSNPKKRQTGSFERIVDSPACPSNWLSTKVVVSVAIKHLGRKINENDLGLAFLNLEIIFQDNPRVDKK